LVDLTDHYTLTTCNECGLLGMAFHPDFMANGYIYLSFTEGPDSNNMTSQVARFRSADRGQTLAGAPERLDILSVAQPFANHNGGHIAFGSDGFLYLGLGDGGSANDPQENGQDINTVLGKMLRMTADGTNADGTGAPDNIVATQGGDARIYAFGLRNPWRWSFDRQSGELWLGDVGQDAFEEVDVIVNGGNYGWRCREGLQPTPGIGNCTLTGGSAIDPVTVGAVPAR
jgi:glucose/arabinose dehydrogenase